MPSDCKEKGMGKSKFVANKNFASLKDNKHLYNSACKECHKIFSKVFDKICYLLLFLYHFYTFNREEFIDIF